MKKFLIGLVTGLLLAGLTAFLAVVAIARLGDSKPSIADGSTLVLRLNGPVPEKPPVEIPLPFFEEQAPTTTQELWTLLDRAATDSRIKAILLMPRHTGAGWGKMQEIRDGIRKFRKSGKPVIAWLSAPNSRDYYLAAAADKIYMSREDFLDLKGLRLESTFVKSTLDKLGVKVDVEHAGKYKDAGDMLTRNSLSPESREVLNSIVDSVFTTLTESIAQGRGKTTEEVRALIDKGPFLAQQAKESGLVDGLLYEDEVLGELKKRLNQSELKKVSHRDYLKASSAGAAKKRIALLVGDGTIVRGDGDDGIASSTFIKQLRRVAADANVAGVILRVDSPGGDGVASDEILREVKLLSQKKPLVISMSDVAASGGYYIAATGDPIIAYPNTLTGSIGVIYGKLNLRGLYDKLGIQKEIITRGKFADLDSDYQPLSDVGRAKLREGIDGMYKGFVSRVAESRKRKFEEIEPLAQGRVWMGTQAKQNGLVDELGGIDRAIEIVKAKAKIGKEEKVRLVVYPPKKSIYEMIFSRNIETSIESKLEARLREVFQGFDPHLWMQGGMMKAMPYQVEIR
jgi:protease IV